MADLTPQTESVESRIQRWLEQDQAPTRDVSQQTSPEPEAEPEEPAAAQESDDDYQPQPNAQVEGDEAAEPAAVRSFADLAKHLEVDEETLAKHLVIPGRDGKEVPLHEVLSAYRTPPPEAAEVERSRARLQELEAGREEAARAAEELRQTAQALARQLQGSQRSEADWAKLRAENPQAYLAAQIEQMQQERQLQHAAQLYQAQAQKAHEEQQRLLAERRREEARKLQAAVPAWKDPKVFEAELGATEKYLVSLGYKSEEILQVSDHRDWIIADKARRWDEAQAKKPAALAKIAQLPKVIAPGASGGADRGATARKAKEDSERLERFKTSGKVEDAADLIRHRLEASARRAAGRTLASGRRP